VLDLNGLASFIGGLGLFFTGLKSLSTHMLQIGGRPLRLAIARLDRRPGMLALVGTAAGTLLQSSNGITLILVSLVTADLVTLATAMPILLWANLGTTVLVLAASIDLRLVSLLLAGVTGLWLYFDRDGPAARRHLLEALLAIAILFLGLELMRTGTAGLRGSSVAATILGWASTSGWIAFALGCGLTLVTQSSSTTTILAAAASQAGLLPFETSALLVLGAGLGSGGSVMLMGADRRGSQRQLVLFQALTKLLGVAVVLPLLVLENLVHLPLLQTAVRWLSSDPGRQLALVYLACQLGSLLAYGLLGPSVRRLLAWAAPPLAAEQLGRPQFISDGALGDVDTALILADKEQARVATLLASRLEPGTEATGPHAARLTEEIGRFLGALGAGTAALDQLELDTLANLQARNEALRALHETIDQIDLARGPVPAGSEAGALADALTVGLGAVLMCVDDAASGRGIDDVLLLKQLTSDRSDLVDGLRRRAIQAESQQTVYVLTSLFERAIWLVQRYALLLETAIAIA
jgi:phosphate:Na+ symporter